MSGLQRAEWQATKENSGGVTKTRNERRVTDSTNAKRESPYKEEKKKQQQGVNECFVMYLM